MAEIFDLGLQQHKIKMDGKFFESNVIAVAGDTARRLEVQLLDSNNMIQDTTGLTLRLNANVAGNATYTEATLINAAEGIYQVDLSNGMLLAPGTWQFQWQVLDRNGNKLNSFAFTGTVGSNISEGGTQATNFYVNADELKRMQDDLVNGTFESATLQTNITEKLTNLETEYAPRLNDVTAQLAHTKDFIISPVFFGASNTSNFDSTTAIQDAIDYASSLGGGIVTLPPGLWRTSSTLFLKKNVTLQGAGLDTTTIQIFSDTNATIIELETNAWKTTPTNQRIKDLTLNGNKTSQIAGEWHGIFAGTSVEGTIIDNVKVHNCKGDGIKYVNSHRNRLMNAHFLNNDGNGIHLTSEFAEGTGSTTDNHVEMNHIFASDNKKHGFYLNHTVDLRATNLASTTNTLDGIFMENPSGNWCNVLDILLLQGNRNGLHVQGGGSFQISNLTADQNSEYNLNVEDTVRGLIVNGSLFKGGEGNVRFNSVTECSVSNITTRILDDTKTNVFISNTRMCNFSNLYIMGGLNGLEAINNTERNNFVGLTISNSVKHAVYLFGTSDNLATYNSFDNVICRNIGSSDYPSEPIIYFYHADLNTLTNYRNLDQRSTKYGSYGLHLWHADDCLVSNSIIQGLSGGIDKSGKNTSIIGSTVIQKTY